MHDEHASSSPGEHASADMLGYEIRRLSESLLNRNAGNSAHTEVPRGRLAVRLATTFGLREIDVDLALAVLAAEIDHEFALLLYGTAARTETGVLAALVPRLEDRLAYLDAIGPDGHAIRRKVLRRVEVHGVGVLAPTRRFKVLVTGSSLFAMFPEFARIITVAPAEIPWVAPPEGALSAMRIAAGGSLCIVSGPDGVGKTTWAQRAAFTVGAACLYIDTSRAARANREVATEISELLDDAALTSTPVVIDNVESMLGTGSRLASIIEDALETSDVRIFAVAADADEVSARLRTRALGHVRISAPSATVRRELWQGANVAPQVRDMLADDLVLTPRQIANAIALIETGADPAVAAFEQLPKAHNLTLPDRATARLDALVLPEDTRREVIELIGAIRSRGYVQQRLSPGRGRAVTALFNGDSGTGKTFACEVVAAEVGLPLMRVNVASLVDKYIGETEKNLERVFAQAQAQGGILFFDEADALFGARTDVTRAQDRYANLETNLLLQLMESFSGVVLLTTNLKQNIDQAFLRRIMFKVYFETPEPKERERIWRSIMPAEEFAEGIDFPRLAKTFELTGGSIRAAALRAAYRAAAAGSRIAMADLVDCAQLETQGMGRVATW